MRRLNRSFLGSDTGPTGISFSMSPSIHKNRFGSAGPRTASNAAAADSPVNGSSPPGQQESGQSESHKQSTLALLDLSSNITESGRTLGGRTSGTPSRNDGSNESPNHDLARGSFEGTNQAASNFSLPSESQKTSAEQGSSASSAWREGGKKPPLTAASPASLTHMVSRTPPSRPAMPFLGGLRPEEMTLSQGSSTQRRESKVDARTSLASTNPDFMSEEGEVRQPSISQAARNDDNKTLYQGEKDRLQVVSEKNPKNSHSHSMNGSTTKPTTSNDVFRRTTAAATTTTSKPDDCYSSKEEKKPASPSQVAVNVNVNALGVSHEKEIALTKVKNLETEDRSHLADYAVGHALRHTVLLHVLKHAAAAAASSSKNLKKGPDLAAMAIELGNYFRGEYVLLHRAVKSKKTDQEAAQKTKSSEQQHVVPPKTSTGNNDDDDEEGEGGVALVSAIMDNISARHSQVLHSWYHDTIQEGGGDAYLPSFDNACSDQWVERCIAAARTEEKEEEEQDKDPNKQKKKKQKGSRLINCEVIRLTATFSSEENGSKGVPELRQEGGGGGEKGEGGDVDKRRRSSKKEVILGVAFVERTSEDGLLTKKAFDAVEDHEGTTLTPTSKEDQQQDEEDSDLYFTRIHAIRIAPWCNPQVWERYTWCSDVVTGRQEEGRTPAHAAEPLDIVSAMFHQILHRSLLYGTRGVSVHSPKEAFFEKFYRKEMGKPVGRDENGCYVFCLGGKERLNVIRKGFETHLTLMAKHKEGRESLPPLERNNEEPTTTTTTTSTNTKVGMTSNYEKTTTTAATTDFLVDKDGAAATTTTKKEKVVEHRVSGDDTSLLHVAGQSQRRRVLEMPEHGGGHEDEESMRKRMRYDDSERHSVDTDRFDDGDEPEEEFRGVEAVAAATTDRDGGGRKEPYNEYSLMRQGSDVKKGVR